MSNKTLCQISGQVKISLTLAGRTSCFLDSHLELMSRFLSERAGVIANRTNPDKLM